MSNWTTEATQRWQGMPAELQQYILDRVWCPHCSEMRTMALDGGTIVADDLVIAGTCAVCGHRMARLLEHETPPPPTSAEQPFQPGESVIWFKRLPGGPYVVPLIATVLAITPKRIKILADDDGKMVTRFVPAESLQRRG